MWFWAAANRFHHLTEPHLNVVVGFVLSIEHEKAEVQVLLRSPSKNRQWVQKIFNLLGISFKFFGLSFDLGSWLNVNYPSSAATNGNKARYIKSNLAKVSNIWIKCYNKNEKHTWLSLLSPQRSLWGWWSWGSNILGGRWPPTAQTLPPWENYEEAHFTIRHKASREAMQNSAHNHLTRNMFAW